jgi:hypothetical protein
MKIYNYIRDCVYYENRLPHADEIGEKFYGVDYETVEATVKEFLELHELEADTKIEWEGELPLESSRQHEESSKGEVARV